jgi:flagellar basal-body rod modification protein FlgD
MTTAAQSTGVDFTALAPQQRAAQSATSASQDRFLKLLVTQLKNQDPLNPMDNAQLTSQLAQISTVEGIGKLNNTLETLLGSFAAAQSLQATSMLGHHVLVPGSALEVSGGIGVAGVLLEGPADSVVVTVRDSAGRVQQEVDIGAHGKGVVPFIWDGTLDQDATAPDGSYTFTVTAKQGGNEVKTTALAYGVVTGVTPSPAGTTMTVGTLGDFAYGDVTQVLQ